MKMVDHNTNKFSDPFTRLPDRVLLIIISFLSIDEAVRTSIISKRWRSMWKHLTHLDFDVKHMICPLTRLTTSPGTHLDFILNLDEQKRIHKYNVLCVGILKRHLGQLTSCRFAHFPFNDITSCILVLLEREKGLKCLTVECEPIDHATSKPNFFIATRDFKFRSSLESFELVRYSLNHTLLFEGVFKNLETLILKEIQMGDEIITEIWRNCLSLKNLTVHQSSGFTVLEINSSSLRFLELNCLCVNHIKIFTWMLEVLVLASISCPAKNVALVAPNLNKFHHHRNQEISTDVPKTQELLEHLTGLFEARRENIFRTLSSLSIDLDLNNLRETLSLSYVLRTSPCLQTLKIVIPVSDNNHEDLFNTSQVDKCSELNIIGVSHQLRSAFWEGRGICPCVYHKLIIVRIEGFTGKDLEFDFIKYLIANSTRMQRITIVGDGSLDAANELRSVKKASSKLLIELMAA